MLLLILTMMEKKVNSDEKEVNSDDKKFNFDEKISQPFFVNS